MGGAFRGRTVWLLAGLFVGGGLIGGGAVATAHTKEFQSTITICDFGCDSKDPAVVTVRGSVLSPKAECVPSRLIIVKASYGGGSFERIGTDKTNSEGRWREDVPKESEGAFISAIKAKVTRKNVGDGDHEHICQSDSAVLSD